MAQTVRVVTRFYRQIAREAAIETYAWARSKGVIVGVVLVILAALASGIGEKGVHVVHAILAGLVAAFVVLGAMFLWHAAQKPVALVEEERRRLRREAPDAQGPASVAAGGIGEYHAHGPTFVLSPEQANLLSSRYQTETNTPEQLRPLEANEPQAQRDDADEDPDGAR
jgi:hypothetical protein